MGVKWRSLPVNYVINPNNPYGLTESFVTSVLSTSAETWDSATSQELFGTYTTDYSARWGVRDNINSLVFGDYPANDAIAVTAIWYTMIGRQILEYDIIFNTRFVWGNATENPAVMDLLNIGTHEVGHSVGLSDIYSSTCSQVTMFGYSWEGDTEKRTLEQPDIEGLQKMYGP